jgi:predicted nucleotidyltransferase
LGDTGGLDLKLLLLDALVCHLSHIKDSKLMITSNDNLSQAYKDLILKAINYHFSDAKIILFGSRARGTNKPGADVDLAIDIGKSIKLHEMARIRKTLENLPLALEIDVVDMHNIPDELKQNILSEGIAWKD